MTDPDSHAAGPRGTGHAASPVPRRVFLGALGAAAASSEVPRPNSAAASAAYTLLSRDAWGADETLRGSGGTEIWPPEYYPVQTLIAHRTDDGSSDPDPAAVIRAIYRNDAVGKGYGYNFLIDRNGLVYEGRWSGTDGTAAHDSGGPFVPGQRSRPGPYTGSLRRGSSRGGPRFIRSPFDCSSGTATGPCRRSGGRSADVRRRWRSGIGQRSGGIRVRARHRIWPGLVPAWSWRWSGHQCRRDVAGR